MINNELYNNLIHFRKCDTRGTPLTGTFSMAGILAMFRQSPELVRINAIHTRTRKDTGFVRLESGEIETRHLSTTEDEKR